MYEQDYVKFETAKLLKAAGYPQEACRVYDSEGDLLVTFSPVTGDEVAAPHIWDAMKWLRRQGLLVVVNFKIDTEMSGDYPSYNAQVYSYGGRIMRLLKDPCVYYNGYEDAYDAGIAAACKWLLHFDKKDKKLKGIEDEEL